MQSEPILRVAVAAPLYSYFDYLPPDGCATGHLVPGVRLQVPFGRGERCGILVSVQKTSDFNPAKIKRAKAILDTCPLFSKADLELLAWAARYYQHPVGEVMVGALPVRLRKGKAQVALGESRWSLSEAGRGVDLTMLRAPRQALVMQTLEHAENGLSQGALYRVCGECRSVLRALEVKGWIHCGQWQPDESARSAVAHAPGYRLNQAQQSAVDAVDLKGFSVSLLDGVTGSGKTEVYLTLASKVLTRGAQVLILVPEIGLTPQLIRRFESRFNDGLAVLHSGLSETERERAWHMARLGHAAVVLGTRSALLTPMPRLGLILVDEEHDLSFKQQDGFRYSARDMAIIRAQRIDCPVLLGSATPSLESLHNARARRYQHLLLEQRAGDAKPPRMDLLDIRSVRLEAGVSPAMMGLMKQTLAAGEQVLLFLNRRGYAPVVTCHDCGWVAQCRRCDARMTLHATGQRLLCHHCGSQRRLESRCPDCNEDDLRTLGQGTERLHEMLTNAFAELSVVRIDRDTTRRKGSLEKLLKEIAEGEHSLLLGTQMLAKGHHFPDVTLVGMIDVDQGLFGADYRAAERMAQQIIQVAGRAGRAEKPGRVLIQTRHPDHPMLQLLIHKGYAAFARESLQERQAAHFPPFSYHALLRAEAPHEQAPRAFLDQAYELAGQMGVGDVELWGPVPAPMERRAGRYRAQLLLQSGSRAHLQQLLSAWVVQLGKLQLARQVRWSIDVDPQEMF